MIPEYLQAAHDEFRAALRRVHPENVTPMLYVQLRDVFLREFDRSEAYLHQLQRLLDEKSELIEQQAEFIRSLHGRRNSRRGYPPQSPAG